MRTRLASLFVGLGVVATFFTEVARAAPVEQSTGPQATAKGQCYALLVGCTEYPNLGRFCTLVGPANDVRLMERVLHEQFAFPTEHIVVLSEAAGRTNPQQLPTRANIKREFAQLAGKAHSGDQVVVLLGGHGSQEPEYPERKPNLPPQLLKEDGLDRIFLPRDTEPWDPVRKIVPNAIVDDELHDWTGKIVATGASLWFIADSCHSGALLRGESTEKPREVSARDGLSIPENELQAARERAEKRGRVAVMPGSEQSPYQLAGAGDRLVALYAAQASEVTVEMAVPVDDNGKTEIHGLLTYTICKALAQSAAPPTYRELVQRIRTRYDAMNRSFPTPLIEGKDLDREVLGEKEFPGRGRFVLKGNAEDGWMVNGGSLNDLTEKSVLAVYDDADKKMGYVEITDSRLLDADVAMPSDPTWQKPAKLEAGWRCEPAYIEYGQHRLRVAPEFVGDAKHPPVTPEQERGEEHRFAPQRKRLRQALASFVAADGGVLELTDDTAHADCLVRSDAKTGKVYLVPGEGVEYRARGTALEEQTQLIGAATIDKMAEELNSPLQRLARARGLLALAPQNERLRGQAAVNVQIDLIKLRNKGDRVGQVVPFQKDGIVLTDRELVKLRITNRSDGRVYPTLLFIDSGYGIQSLYPESGQIAQALEPNSFVTTGVMRVTSKTLGRERVMVLAVKAGREPVDFSFLEQPTIERARGLATRGQADPLDTPLGQLLQNAVYRQGGTRGVSVVHLDEYGTALLSWQTRPAK